MSIGNEYILAIDQGTSATKAILFDSRGQRILRVNTKHKQFHPNPGWVEHDAEEIYERTLEAVESLVAQSGVGHHQIKAIAISNQRETAVVWDKNTGKPISNAVVWQCNRASDICELLSKKGKGDLVKEKTGLVLSPYFSAAKVKWILDNVEGARKKAINGELLFGTIDAWLVWKLTNGQVHATDYSNASRTQLFNIKELKWDNELLEIFTVPASMLPEVKCSDELFGKTDCNHILNHQIPISGVMGDSHAALFGQKCFQPGETKVTYGTGSSIMMNIGKDFIESENGIVTSIAWGYNKEVNYVFEGNINCAGATIMWLIDNLQILEDSASSEPIARSLDSNEGVYLVPAFVGLGAPYWDSNAKASIMGISRGTDRRQLIRAALESIAYQIKDIVDVMVQDSNLILNEIKTDGGPTRNGFLMQFQSDMLNVVVATNGIEELSAIGAAYMAGLSVGIWKDTGEIQSLTTEVNKLYPSMDGATRTVLYEGWKNAIRRTLSRVC